MQVNPYGATTQDLINYGCFNAKQPRSKLQKRILDRLYQDTKQLYGYARHTTGKGMLCPEFIMNQYKSTISAMDDMYQIMFKAA